MRTPHEILLEQGDLLERKMFSDPTFASSFELYPIIWSLYVLSNRKPGFLKLADSNWLQFAERHYSCIVRCWMAYVTHQDIASLCSEALDSPTAYQHLSLHRLLFQLFCSFGAAIDNLRFAFAAPPIDCPFEFEKIYARDDSEISLKWLYERRTQYIHKSIVPCFDRNGLLSLDASLFDDTETEWFHRRPIQVKSVAELCEWYWSCFVDQMHSSFSKLLELLKNASPATVAEIRFTPLQPSELNWGSASPSNPHGLPELPPPSGCR